MALNIIKKYPFSKGRSKITNTLSKYISVEANTIIADFDGNLKIDPKQFVSKQISFLAFLNLLKLIFSKDKLNLA